jgi:hypothetical protein
MTDVGKTRRWKSVAAWTLVVAASVYTLIYCDVVSRAKESYLKGETYMDWAAHPDVKKAALEAQFSVDKSHLEKKRATKTISDEEFQRRLDALSFDLEQSLQESSVKYAYQWYKDTFELFSPPESKWVRMARTKAPVAVALWKKELDEKKIPYDDTMVE